MDKKCMQLQKEIEQLRAENTKLKSAMSAVMDNYSKTDILNLPWIGNLGHWHWYVPDNIVKFNDAKVTALGYEISKVGKTVDYQFFTEKLHPDDYEYVMDNMRDHLYGKTDAYEVSYRIQHIDGHYVWFYDRGVVIERSDDGAPLVLGGIVFDISEQKRVEENLKSMNIKLHSLTMKDDLTRIFNRRALQSMLERELDRFLRYHHPLSIIFIDIDKFKQINDQYGHVVGDHILQEVAEVMLKSIRHIDILGRWGGDEFLIISPHTNREEAVQLAKRIKLDITQNNFCENIALSASFGIAESLETDMIDDIIQRADKFMYESKKTGGNEVGFKL